MFYTASVCLSVSPSVSKLARLAVNDIVSFVFHLQRNVCIGVDLAGILRVPHGERQKCVGAEWDGVW